MVKLKIKSNQPFFAIIEDVGANNKSYNKKFYSIEEDAKIINKKAISNKSWLNSLK